jgi:hypothetical protein
MSDIYTAEEHPLPLRRDADPSNPSIGGKYRLDDVEFCEVINTNEDRLLIRSMHVNPASFDRFRMLVYPMLAILHRPFTYTILSRTKGSKIGS